MKKIKDGFPEQRRVVLSRELITRQQELRVCRHLHITDIGHFPKTENHYVARKKGIGQYILIFCTAGRGTATLRGDRYEMSAGQIMLIPPGLPHEYQASATLPWNIYWFHFTGDQAEEYAELLSPEPRQPILQISDIDELVRQFERLYSCVVSAFSDSALVSASAELTRTLCLIHQLKTGRHKKSRQSEERILNSIEMITREYQAPHTLEELARQAGLSVPHYTALFRKQTGTSPLRYLTRVRLRHAGNLLERTALPIAEIAEAVGYEDAFYFSRIFHKNTGHSPSTYRKLNSAQPPR